MNDILGILYLCILGVFVLCAPGWIDVAHAWLIAQGWPAWAVHGALLTVYLLVAIGGLLYGLKGRNAKR